MTTASTGAALAARAENLALIFQEPFTVIVRLRSNRQHVANAESFRQQFKNSLATSGQQALQAGGYPKEIIRLATFAVVGFLDESILNSQNPIFAAWPRKPLQEELFGTHMAGEVFFQSLQGLLERDDSPELADVLEVHYLCLLLGFRGRYSTSRGGELQGFMRQTADKIGRIRGRMGPLSPAWQPGVEPPAVARDAWTRRLAILAVCCLVILIASFLLLKISLRSGVSTIQAITAQFE